MDNDTFTIEEMREAYGKLVRGEPLTEKERSLAEARAAAVRWCSPKENLPTGSSK